MSPRPALSRFAQAAGAAAGVSALAAWLFREALFLGATFSRGDLSALHRPMKRLVTTLAASSDGVPLWNPMLAAGQPFAANPAAGLFHPMTALFFLLPFEWAFRLQVVLPVVGAVFAMRFLASSVGAGPAAALVAGLAFGLGGYALSATCLLPTLFSLAVLPAFLGFCVRLASRSDGRNLAGAALLFGILALAGEPSALLSSVPLAAVATLAGMREGRSPVRAGAALAGAVLLGCGVAAATLVPGVRHASMTARADGISSADAAEWSLPPGRLAELFLSDVTGAADGDPRGAATRRALYPSRGTPYLASLYPGLLVTLLAGAAWLRVPGSRPWAAVALGGAALALGSHTPVWAALRHLVPLLGGIRYPEKFALLVIVPIVVSAALGLELLARSGPALRRRAAAAFALLGLALGLSSLAAGPIESGLLSERFRRGSLVSCLASGALLVAPLGPPGLVVGLGAVVVLDLLSAGRPLVPPSDLPSSTRPPSFLAPLLAGPSAGYLFHHASYHPRLATLPGLAAPPVPSQWGVATALDRDWDLTAPRWSHVASGAVSDLLRSHPGAAGFVFARRGIASVLSFRPGLDATSPAPGAPLDGLLRLTRVVGARPLAFCVEGVVAAEGAGGWQLAVAELGGRAAAVAVADPADWPGSPSAVSPGRVEVLTRRADRLVLSVEAAGPAPAVVAINQTWDPGWEARVDGTVVPLRRVDLSLQALETPAGTHRVELVYRNGWVTAGIAVSLLSLAACAGLAARRRQRFDAAEASASRASA